MNLMRGCLITICWLVAVFANAQNVYQSKDAHGNPVFTDQPKPGAEKLDVKPTNVTPALTPRGGSEQTEAPFNGYSRIGVSVPNPVPNGLAPTTVGIVTEPVLQPGHSWQLKLDGGVVATGTEPSATIPRLDRGDHTFSVDIIGGSGLIGSSDPIDVFVFWPGGTSNRPKVTPH